MTRRISVAIPAGVDRAFTYVVPEGGPPCRPGSRVWVPFGRRIVTGVVRAVAAGDDVPTSRLRAVVADLDEGRPPTVPRELLDLAEWVADYYLAPIGEVLRGMLPGLLSRADVRRLVLTAEGESALSRLAAADPRRRLLSAVAGADGGLPAARLPKLQLDRPFVLLAEAEAEGWVEDADTRDEGPSMETVVRATHRADRRVLDEAAASVHVGRSKLRRRLLDVLQDAYDEAERSGEKDAAYVPLAVLRQVSPGARRLLEPLERAGLVELAERPRARDPFAVPAPGAATAPVLTSEQAEALARLAGALNARTFTPALLEGITGSGKTEVYLHLIAEVRAQGGGALVLVPEIALTPQLAGRFQARFPGQVAVLHSGLSPRRRADTWYAIRRGEVRIVVGARSAVFAPVEDLRAVVVDEEHDPSFKQDEGVRYHGRDVALVRAKRCGAVAVLGSATPSLETYEHARRGSYLHLRLSRRPTPRPLPAVEVVSLAVDRPDAASLLSARLAQALRETVAAGDQAILFLNRRGFATALQCRTCGTFVQCPDCSAPSMTYHMARNRLVCHLCGRVADVPRACPGCGGTALERGGVGTERVETELAKVVPEATVLRLDRDTAQGRRLHRTLEAFRAGRAQVLVGTQMLTKGHDFPGVTLVGVIRADQGLGLPDPRARERVFQLVSQVAGRAGRGDRPGRVIVQAYAVDDPAVKFAARHDYAGFAAQELAARRELGNPPFGYLALVRVTGTREPAVALRAKQLADGLRARAKRVGGVSVLGPAPAYFAKVNRRFRVQILVRSPSRPPLRALLRMLRPALGQGPGGTMASVDVDPQNLL